MRTIVVYPGRFHPFHRGHKASYDYLVKQYGVGNVFVVSSDKQDAESSPFSFADKMVMMTKLGIAPGRIAQVKNPYQAKEITSEVDDPENTVLIFAVSEKDMTGPEARFSFAPKKDGSAGYMQPLPDNIKQAQPMTKHAYVTVTPTVNFKVRGADANSASQIRNLYTKGNQADREQIIADLYGDMDADIRDIFDRKLTQKDQVKDIVAEGIGSNLKTWTLMKLANLVQKAGFIDDERFQDWLSGAIEETRMEMMAFLRSHPNREHIAPKVNAMMDRLKDSRTPEQFSRGAQIITDFINQAIYLKEFAPGGAGIVPPPTAKKKDPFEPDDRSQVLMTIKRLLAAGNKIDSMLAGSRGHIYAVAADLAGFSAKKLNKPHARGGFFRHMDEDDDDRVFLKLIRPGYYQLWDKELAEDYVEEKWSQKYKDSINCANPKGFSQRAHCQGRKK